MLLSSLLLSMLVNPTPLTMNESHGRYYGAPDLALTSSMIAAGGGPAHFSSQKLFLFVAGPSANTEAASLTKRYGAKNVQQFFVTFDSFVDRAVGIVEQKHIALPPPDHENGEHLARSLYAAGVMPDGRYDVGYMIEHLLSRKMHVALMQEVNADPAIGPQQNAEFHIILTSAMQDLHRAYD
jgi:hypothetical protein